jgi:hypothetical protein
MQQQSGPVNGLRAEAGVVELLMAEEKLCVRSLIWSIARLSSA